MRKKTLSLALALVMCLGLTVPAFAADGMTVTSSPTEPLNITFDGYLRTEYIDAGDGESFFAVYVVKDGSTVHIGNSEHAAQYGVLSNSYGYSPETGAFWVDSGPLSLGGDISTIPLTVTPAETAEDVLFEMALVPGFGGNSYCWMCESNFARIAPKHTGVPGPGSEILGTVGPEYPTESTQPTVPSFSDVKADAFYAEPVAWAVEKGVTAGTSKTTFSPNATCTQGQILTFLWRAKGEPKPAGAVSGTQYYAAAAQWAKEQGLTDNFSAEADCTRSMVVTYLWKLAGSPKTGASHFSDVPANAAYAQAVTWAVEQNITNGTSATTFTPGETCTRGQIVTLLYRMMGE